MLKLNLCVVKRSLAFPRLKPKIICQALHSKAFIVPRWYFLLFPFAKISEILFTRAGKYNLHFENKMMKYFGQRERSKRLYITHPAFSQNLSPVEAIEVFSNFLFQQRFEKCQIYLWKRNHQRKYKWQTICF